MSRWFVILIAALSCTHAPPAEPGAIVIRDVTVIPMTGEISSPNQSVIIRDGQIVETGAFATGPHSSGRNVEIVDYH